ncbi:hypothetical protein MKW92_053444 [Papaver armeniacum]|nr:hypothetical protein MKW92_053444 [Papaver armeniacum]
MGLEKFINGILLIYFPLMVIKAPLLDLYMFLPATSSYGNLLFHFYTWYGDYLKLEKPHFYVGIVWLELLVKWPLCIANFYGLLNEKSWVKTTCLIYGVSTVTVMVAIFFDMVMSSRPSTLMSLYIPFMVFGLITTLKGLIPIASPIDHVRKKTSDGAKKRA